MSGLNLDIPSVDDLTLREAMQYSESIQTKHYPAEHVFAFHVLGPNISSNDWLKLIDRSKVSLFLQSYAEKNAPGKLEHLFIAPDDYSSIDLNPGNDGSMFFIGKARVKGIYTKAAFDYEVLPVLTRLPEWLHGLPIYENEKDRFFRISFQPL